MEEFDVIIIGSGAGGAPVAVELAATGKRVLVLEKGPLLRTQGERADWPLSDFKRDELFGFGTERIITVPDAANTGASFYPSPIEPDLNDEPHLHTITPDEKPVVTIEGYTAQAVGGGTQLYGAVSLRFAPDDFRLHTVNEERRANGMKLGDDPDGTALQHLLDWPVQYADLEPWYTKAERLVGINGTRANQLKPVTLAGGDSDPYQKPRNPNPISEVALKGMISVAADQGAPRDPYRTPLAVITEDHGPSGRKAGDPHTGYVNRYGDPLGYKSNTWVAFLRPALAQFPDALTLRPNCNVTHLVADGGRISAVHYRDAGGQPREATAKIVVVACSAIESVRLLMISAEHDRPNLGKRLRYGEANGLLGRFFLTHCFGGAEAAFKAGFTKGDAAKKEWVEIPGRRFDKSISLDSDYATDFTSDPKWIVANGLFAGAAIYNNTSDQALPISLARTHGSTDLDSLWQGFMGAKELWGEKLLEWLCTDLGTRLSVSFMANQVPQYDNHIRLHPSIRDKWKRPAPHILKTWHPHDGFLMNRLAGVCRNILEQGAQQQGIEISSIESGSVYGVRVSNTVRIANHILGGARFGTSPDVSVLDPDCRAWELDNLYVTDGSFMPTSGGANPTLTIQANAFRVADILKTRL